MTTFGQWYNLLNNNFGYMKDHMRELKDVKDIHDRNSVQRDLSIRKKVKGVKKRSQVELLRK